MNTKIISKEEALIRLRASGYVRIGQHSATSEADVEEVYKRIQAWDKAARSPVPTIPDAPVAAPGGSPAVKAVMEKISSLDSALQDANRALADAVAVNQALETRLAALEAAKPAETPPPPAA